MIEHDDIRNETRPFLQIFWQKHARTIVFASIALFGSLLIGGTARMVNIAFDSQPECVAHSKPNHSNDLHPQAAKSSC